MCHYEQATICKNGHAISIHGRTSEKCCSNCGAENISQCQNCNANIHGWDENIMVETPKTTLAATRIKKALLTAGHFTADALRQFVIDFGCELAIKSINL